MTRKYSDTQILNRLIKSMRDSLKFHKKELKKAQAELDAFKTQYYKVSDYTMKHNILLEIIANHPTYRVSQSLVSYHTVNIEVYMKILSRAKNLIKQQTGRVTK